MHDQHTIRQFIALRARGISYQRIAQQLDIASGTASDWGRIYGDEIQRARIVQMEAVQERYLKSYEEQIGDLVTELDEIDTELQRRNLADVSTEFLLYRKDLVKLRLGKLAVSPGVIAAVHALPAPKPKIPAPDAPSTPKPQN